MATWRTTDGDMVDAICKAHYGTEDMVEAVHEANPRLAAIGPVLPKGLVLTLPEAARPAASVARPIRLWGRD